MASRDKMKPNTTSASRKIADPVPHSGMKTYLSAACEAVPLSKTRFFRNLFPCPLLVPGAEETAEDDEFAEMVGVMVGDEEGFAEEVLAIAPGKGFIEV